MLEYIKNPLMRSLWDLMMKSLSATEQKNMFFLMDALHTGQDNAQDIKTFQPFTLKVFVDHWKDLTSNQLYTMAYQLLQEGYRRKELESKKIEMDKLIEEREEGVLCL